MTAPQISRRALCVGLSGTALGPAPLALPIVAFTVLASIHDPQAITAGPDGNLWLTDGNAIWRMSTSGTSSEFSLPGSEPQGLTAGPDGNLWFVEETGDRIGRITPEG